MTSWSQNNLTICGQGGRARLFANGQNAAGKGIWVIGGSNVVVDSIEFHGATVPDENGAGIRAEGNGLTIRNSGFYDNENGILGPDRGDLVIDRSEFARNGYGDGYSHNIYIGYANRVTVTSSFFRQAKIGHNFKSRAAETRIENSYFMDGPSGTASYQVDVPNGGAVYLRGNLIHKGPNADNSIAISFGAEGLTSGRTHTLTLIHNTLVSTYQGGAFINASSGIQSISLVANLFAGTNGPPKYNSGVASKVTETSSLVTTAGNITAPTDVVNPNFWPASGILGQTLLATPADATYTFDAGAPFTLRAITGTTRRIGALQSAP